MNIKDLLEMKNFKAMVMVLIMMCCIAIPNKGIAQKKQKKKNVLVIYTDDHRYTGVHALGNQQVKTPHIDRLAEEGIRFNKTYLMGAITGATCVPSRAMLLTGRNMFSLKGEGRHIPKVHTTMGETFQKAGYNTHIVGKWHQDIASLSRSFDSGSTIMSLGVYLQDHFRMPMWDWDKTGEFPKDKAYLLEYNKKGKIIKRTINKQDKRGQIGNEKLAPHSSEVFANSASKFIKQYHKKDPFFMYLAFHAPHDPRQAPQKYKDMYPVKDVELTPSYMTQHPFDNGHLYIRDERLAAFPRTKTVAQEQLASYYAIITHLDDQIGKVIQALKDSNQYENTIIVLAGDSGLAVGNHGLMGKQNLYDEDGIHVPFIISGGIEEKGEEVNAYSYIHDIFPTVCDLANIKMPESVLGKSLKPVIKGEAKAIRDYTYHAYRQHQRAYRKGDYKLIEFVKAPEYNSKKKTEQLTGSKVTLLFNITKDPWETQNLSFFPEYKKIVTRMKEEMREKAIRLGDKKENLQDLYIPRLSLKYDFWDYY